MSGKRPQPTALIIKRLQRVARWLDRFYNECPPREQDPRIRARANVCWQAAGRLTEYARQGEHNG